MHPRGEWMDIIPVSIKFPVVAYVISIRHMAGLGIFHDPHVMILKPDDARLEIGAGVCLCTS
jgi:hypothetical protein